MDLNHLITCSLNYVTSSLISTENARIPNPNEALFFHSIFFSLIGIEHANGSLSDNQIKHSWVFSIQNRKDLQFFESFRFWRRYEMYIWKILYNFSFVKLYGRSELWKELGVSVTYEMSINRFKKEATKTFLSSHNRVRNFALHFIAGVIVVVVVLYLVLSTQEHGTFPIGRESEGRENKNRMKKKPHKERNIYQANKPNEWR